MKKTLLVLLSLLMIMTAFTGCASESKDTSSTKEIIGTTNTNATAATTAASSKSTEATSASTAAPTASATEPSATAAEDGDYAYITGKGKMTIGITYFEPMNYLDDENNLTGFETEFATAVCGKLGITPEFVEIVWTSKETELAAKSIDCIWNGMTIDDERLQNMTISVPYMKNKQVIVTKAANAEKYATAEGIKDAVIVAESGSAGEKTAQQDPYFANASLTPVDSQASALLEVKAGTADAAIIDYVMTIGSIGEGTDYTDLVLVDTADFAPEEYGIAFRKGSISTVTAVNNAIQELANDGTLATIAEKYKLKDLLLVQPK